MTTSDDNPEFHADPELDACLDELLGGISPPELSAQILSRLEDKNGNSRQHPDDSLASFSEDLRPRINTQSSADRRASRHGSSPRRGTWARHLSPRASQGRTSALSARAACAREGYRR